ncbi:MAG: ATP-binding protein [Anaerolineaceae bacterium]|jgi:two-component system sensor histidine kinase DegS
MAILSTSPFTAADEFQQRIINELANAQASLKEVTATLAQSQMELNRLAQRQAAITSALQQIEMEGDRASKTQLRESYRNAMDAQQRLLVMRGQLDKLQEQQSNLQTNIELYQQMQDYLTTLSLEQVTDSSSSSGGASLLEMLINSQEAERQRLSRQMHDGPAQALSNFIVQAEIASKLFDMDPGKGKEELERLKTSAMGTFQKVRTYINDLRPMMLDDLGLVPTLQRYIANLREINEVDITLNVVGSEHKLEPYIDVFIFRSIQEIISNAMKHNAEMAGKVKIEVEMDLETSTVKTSIKDNGVGFNVDEIKDSGGLGLKLIRERVEMLAGKLAIYSEVGKGTEVIMIIPITEALIK